MTSFLDRFLVVTGNQAPGTAYPVYQLADNVRGQSRAEVKMVVSDLHGDHVVRSPKDEARFWSGMKRCVRQQEDPSEDSSAYRRKSSTYNHMTKMTCDNGFTSLSLTFPAKLLSAGEGPLDGPALLAAW